MAMGVGHKIPSLPGMLLASIGWETVSYKNIDPGKLIMFQGKTTHPRILNSTNLIWCRKKIKERNKLEWVEREMGLGKDFGESKYN